MSQNASFRKTLLGAAILGLASVFLAVGDARAGTLIINITDGTTTYDIFDQIPPDTNVALNKIAADVSGLTFTTGWSLVSLGASSNNPGADNPSGAVLTVNGEAQLAPGSSGGTLTITTYQTDYNLPSGAAYQMISTSAATTTNVPGGSTQTFESWYNPASPATPPPPFGTPAPLISLPLPGTGQNGGTSMLNGLPSSADFSLTNQIVLTLSAVPSTQSTAADVAFSGQTQILATAIPEPTSVIMLGTAAPLALVLLSKIRRGRKQAAA
jgi:hypothetical protein